MNSISSGTPVASPTEAPICSICHDDLYHPECPEFVGRRVVIAKPCGHKFHLNCLDPWTAGHLECPYGRKPIEDVVVEILTLPAGWQDRMVDAAKAGDTGTIRSLLNRGADVDAGQPAGSTPLAWAATNGYLDAARLLADRGAGDPVGLNNLGWMYLNVYLNGEGVEQDYGEAAKWLRKAAEQGHDQAQAQLGWMYLNGEGVEQDYGEAVKWLRKAADQGHAPAQSNLGYMYEFGRGVEQDYGEAVKWYRAAVDQGEIRVNDRLNKLLQNLNI